MIQTGRGEKCRLRTAWELPELIRPLPIRKARCARKPLLQRHQPAILEFIYQSRFATASHVQRRFPNWLKTARTTQWQLANLVELGYLATAPVRSTSPNFPFVYFTTGRGVTLINKTYAAHGLPTRYPTGEGRKSTGAAIDSMLHELLLTEFELAVKLTVDSGPNLKLLSTERRYFRRERQLRFTTGGRTHRVIPDAGFMLRVGESEDGMSQNNSFATLQHFVELDNGTMPPARFLEKLKQYDAWSASESGRKYLTDLYERFGARIPQGLYRLLIVVHDKQKPDADDGRLASLFQQSLELPGAMRDRLWFVTAADLKARQHNSPPLADSLWHRGRDAKGYLQELRQISAKASSKECRRFVIGFLSELPHHPLFPQVHLPNSLC